ncbi:tRNA lysidine(34) synthetase TilS [Deinococcus rubellus]|uniref:Multifunctional fusion protein n=1 Tax=Deinococcus rubellus TaxID=1889240 RepID=A0ABY5YLJ8_9DEIO|nr:tRNA lysidine(34) synthetase TilS [Deinococcus rubellus]UWX65551.1 tRNA lysidine(34) synthetase TilS [Deinococcus rubellus]
MPPARALLTPLLAPLRHYAQALSGPLVVGVSGGADSVALLRALLLVGASPVVAHLDHQLRPESAADAEWVAALCRDLGVPCELGRAPVARVAEQRGWTTEEAARRLRYDFLARVARQRGLKLILTAHTRNDQAETVLWQVLRGEAVLSGIAPVRGALRRPWLGVSRGQITAALDAWQQTWREDASNADTSYTRNWLRAEVMPPMRTRFPGLDERLSRLARHQAEDDAVLSDLAGRFTLHTPRRGQSQALLRRLVRRDLVAAGLTFHAAHLDALASALSRGVTHHLSLPAGRDISVIGGPFPRLELPRSDSDPAHDWLRPEFAFPPDWTLRRRQAGDRIRLSAGERKLSDVLTDLRVPRAERDRLWLLAGPAGVQWLGIQPPVWALGAREQVDGPPLSGPEADHYFMGEALRLAEAAARAGEVPVGALVVRGTEVIASAANRSRELGDMTRHAELEALRQAAQVAGPYLTGFTLYVTLEPCPMCLGAALEARLGRLVYGASNPRAGALGGVSDLLAHAWGHPLSVTPGVRAAQAARLLKAAFAEFRAAAP